MPNTKDINMNAVSALLYGESGSGKTTLGATMPGRKFIYSFDPGGLASVRYIDAQYEEFLSDIKGVKLRPDKSAKPINHERAYQRWEADFEKRLSSGWFTDPNVEIDGIKGGVDSVGLDSITTFSDLTLTELQYINGRTGLPPDYEHEYFPQMNLIERVLKTLLSLGINVWVCAHERVQQDGVTKRIKSELAVTGGLRHKLPLLFDEVYHCEGRSVKGIPQYVVLTRPDSIYGLARTRLGTQGKFSLYEDITLNFEKPIEEQGFGKLLKKARSNSPKG